MKKKNLAAGILLAGTAAALTGAGAVFHNIIVRKKTDPTDLIVSLAERAGKRKGLHPVF